MEIVIQSNGSSSVSLLRSRIKTLKSDINDTISQLKRINNGLSNINGPVNNNILCATNGINARIHSEEQKKNAISEIDRMIKTFVDNAVAIDKSIAQKIKQNEHAFYNKYPWHKPSIIPRKKSWENPFEKGREFLRYIGNKLKDAWTGIVSFVKEHAVELIIGTAFVAIAILLTFLSGGTFLAAVFAVFKSVGISMLVNSAISSSIALITGGDVKKAFFDGLASGYMFGAIFASLSAGVKFYQAIRAGTARFQLPSSLDSKVERPSWRASEKYAESKPEYKTYKPQQTYENVNGEWVEKSYGKKGCCRFDLLKKEVYRFKNNVFKYKVVEVKNYSIHLESGRRSLIYNIKDQYFKRIANRTAQTYLIETRGMQLSREILEELSKKILEATGKGIKIRYLF